mgnify:FL=1|tara:strand:+ start:639 stop:875 length:237 start_codon:yes stop_codon:yes gene_type:complete
MTTLTDKERNNLTGRHGGPYDRGSADYYYWRDYSPHYYVGDTYNSLRIEEADMTEREIEAYRMGYTEAEECGDRKDYR